jgi:hypothetical protein
MEANTPRGYINRLPFRKKLAALLLMKKYYTIYTPENITLVGNRELYRDGIEHYVTKVKEY